MRVSELFVSFQGEGMYLGIPAFFIRTSGCNLRCRWDTQSCDSQYAAWENQGSDFIVEEIIDQLQSMKSKYPGVAHVIITGGEPTIQEDLVPLTVRLKECGFFIHLETNGTQFPMVGLCCDFVSLSPKLSSARVSTSSRLSENLELNWEQKCNILQRWIDCYPYQLKFVLFSHQDEEEILMILRNLSGISTDRVILMPEGVTTTELHERALWILEICYRHGFRYTPRAHIELFGNQRGR